MKGNPMTTQDYYGTKRVTAWPQNKNPALIASEEGYAVMYDGGYTSWSPKDVFEAAYQPITAMSFGHAIEAMKSGHRVARAGWNGKDMWLALSGPTGPREIAAENFWSKHNAEYARQNGGSAKVLPCITMKTASGEILMGWLASQTDMLSDDWLIVE
jgi:hypothetical protein